VRVLGIARRMIRPEVQARVLRTMARDLAIYQELWAGSEAGGLLARSDPDEFHALAEELDPRPELPESAARRRRAFHEAGHAVAGLLFGTGIPDFTLSRDDSARHPIPRFSCPGEEPPEGVESTRLQEMLQRRVQTLLAGEVAQELAGFPAELGTEADEEAILQSAMELGADLDVQAAFVTWMRWTTRELLASPEQWWKVEAVAETLLERGSMTPEEVRGVLDGSVRV
jgi:hypothetical protein